MTRRDRVGMVGAKSFRNVGQKRFVGIDGLLRFASVCICFGKTVAGSNRGGVPAAKSPNLIAEKRLIHGNCLERVSRLHFSKVLFGISCRFVYAGSGRFVCAEFVCSEFVCIWPSRFVRVGLGQFVGGGAQELIVEAPCLFIDCLADFRRG